MILLYSKRRLSSALLSPCLYHAQVAYFHTTPPQQKHIVSLEVDVVKEGHLDKKNWIFKEDKHKDMSTFMSKGYSQSNYFTGTKFEYETILALEKFNFSLERIGKAGDEGVDFKGVSHPFSAAILSLFSLKEIIHGIFQIKHCPLWANVKNMANQ